MLVQLIDHLWQRIQLVARCHIHLHSRDTAVLLHEAEVCDKHNDVKGAEKALYRALKLDPRHGEALYRMGQIAQRAGQIDAAIEWIAKAIAARPQAASFYNTHGNLKFEQGKNDEAEQSYLAAIALGPNLAEPHANLGMVLCERGEFLEGVRLFRKAIEIDPRLSYAHHNLGNAHHALGEYEAAVASYRHALELKPEAFETQCSLATSLQALGDFDAALAGYRRALELRPDHAETHYGLGNLLCEMGRFDDAAASLDRAIHLQPGMYKAHNGLGIVLLKQGKLDGAISALNHALAQRPDYAVAHNNLGMALQRHGKPGEAIAAYRRALECQPDLMCAHSNLVFALNYSTDYTPEEVFQEHLEWARRHSAPLKHTIKPHHNLLVPERKLRIGYVSANFCDHPVNYFFEPTLKNHDTGRFEVFCYSDVRKPDAYTHRLRGYPCVWRDTAGLTDEALARLIGGDEVDILVDLSGHIAEHRLLVFARKPAPIQVTWNGYPNTTGMDVMDYRITDVYADPVGMTEHLHTEQLVRLPEIYMAYQPPEQAPPVTPPPSIANGYVTFGSFNTLYKVGPRVIAVWARILKALPTARLLLFTVPEGKARAQLVQVFVGEGIAPERIEMIARLPSRQFLEAHRRADIALDPFPYNGTTTTCQTLWMGVPLITLAGRSHVSRVGVSMLTNLGLARLIARDEQEYVALAVGFAQDCAELATLRSGLRQRMLTSPNTDGARLTRFLEAAYANIWKDYCVRAAAR